MSRTEKIVGLIDLIIETLFIPLLPFRGEAWKEFPESPLARKLLYGR